MRALLTLGIYAAPFLLVGIAAKSWMLRHGVSLPDIRSERGSRPQPRFLLGIWRRDD